MTQHTSRTIIGAVIGAAVALIWIAFGTKALLVFVGLTVVGAIVGTALERPQRLIDILERLQDR